MKVSPTGAPHDGYIGNNEASGCLTGVHMSGSPDRRTQDQLDIGSLASGLGGGTRERYELANAVEDLDHEEGSICYIYPVHASDTELETRWLAVPAGLLVDLEAAR